MKYIFLLVFPSFLLFACSNSDTKTAASAEDSLKNARISEAANDTAQFTSIQWLDSTAQNLGKINEGQVAEVSWHFKNTGTTPLVIVSVTPSCGCTVADKPEEPIAPGKEGVIKAKFDSKGQGVGIKEKTVTVQTNTKNGMTHQLSFRGEVVQK
ncbi:MAG: DUF1573 domain-containing protein [Chitinophagaceae bacterium]